MRRKKNLATRHARKIRRGIIGARLATQALNEGNMEHAERIYYTVSSFGGLTQKALFREFAALTVG